ncbi:MAG: CotH kinase family protein, partial [Planctomycetota bacterium]
VYGDFEGNLGDAGELISVSNELGDEIEVLRYDDRAPWDAFADGLGASLERLCYEADAADPANWRAGAVPSTDRENFGGSPGAVGSQQTCPPAARDLPSVQLSEIMYHAVLEEAFEDRHEFIEIRNSSDAEMVSIAGWRLVGGVEYTFPEGAVLAEGQYRVIAADREALAAVESYELNVDDIFGNYDRRLDNGGERVGLIDADGNGVDYARYDDDFPWPIAADALGAGQSWLSTENLPLERHRYRGRSLERISFSQSAELVSSWDVSPLDEATPGKPNTSNFDVPPSIVSDLSVVGPGGDGELIRADEQVRLQVSFSPVPPSGRVEVEFFVDDLNVTTEDKIVSELVDDGSGGDFIAGDGVFSAFLPGQDDGSIVRYRVNANRGGEDVELVSPRPSDPNPWHAYFVNPVINTETRTYQVYVSPRNWGQMWTNVSSGRASGCSLRPTWNNRVPAVFIYEGEVHDVQVRYQGSRWNRTNGRNISNWRFPRPTTGSFRALSWRIAFPRYNQFQGRSVVTLNKLSQACPGFNSGVGYRLFGLVDLPSPETRYVRYHVNGGYYNYMMEYERPGEDMIRRYNRDQAEKYPERPREEIGHLYKSSGCNCDEGPYGWGDHRILPARCGFTAEERYSYTFDRKTHDWDTHLEFKDLIENLHRARRDGPDAMRAYFEQYWDVDLLLDYCAVMNWAVPFDDMFQNHFIYQRRSDGKWMLCPWDLDRNFGEWQGANSSIFMGEQGNSSNRSGWWHYTKGYERKD